MQNSGNGHIWIKVWKEILLIKLFNLSHFNFFLCKIQFIKQDIQCYELLIMRQYKKVQDISPSLKQITVPFLYIIHGCCCCYVTSVASDSMRPHGRQLTRLPRPWESPGKNTGVGCHFLLQCMKVKSESEVAQSCPTLCDSIDSSPAGSSVYRIL